MVFYNSLPTELWFYIYKIEHAQKMKSVHDEIKSISETVTMLNIGAEDIIQRNTQGKMVANIFEMLPTLI